MRHHHQVGHLSRNASEPSRPGQARSRAVTLLAGLTLALSACGQQPSPVAGADHPALAAQAQGDLGPNVIIFDPGMPLAEIQAKVDAVSARQVDSEMGSGRYALLFKPGVYGTATRPLHIQVGYYTEVAGLGASPGDVTINGKVEVYNRCLGGGGTSNCLALVNFWRSLSNLTINVNGTGQDGCRASANFWAVSQAAPMRRVDIVGGNLSLMDYCTAGPQYASGGFIADSRAGTVINGSQQQFLTRNSVIGQWSNGVWNQVFAGVEGAPSEAGFPNPPYTTLDTTPVSREKPYLTTDAGGRLSVVVPQARTNSRGVSWRGGPGAGRTIPLSDFFVARPGDSAATINGQLARGRHLLFTPGVYDINLPLVVWRANTVVLGLGLATLTARGGAVPLVVADTATGATVSGLMFDAGGETSPALLRVGARRAWGLPRRFSDPGNPITLSDVYFRVGGPHVGKADIGLEVSSNNVLIDHAWVWRADHGVEGFSGDTERWTTNLGRNGVVVSGDNVTATGLFVEHFQQDNTVWNGENGTTILYQNELPYDPPTQADWGHGGVLGWAGYKVGDTVKTHRLYGGGVYVFNQNNPSIHTANGFEVPITPGVRLHHIMTVNLGAGTIDHVVNGVGGPADTSRVGQPVYVTDYPTP
ncbi:secreted protein [Deinococcus aerius]|uniref:Secreted protein n=1 Tax=Deinococcus aerius TaxID=200253 RepID=A0A2I9CXE6_9DEIO|nr:adenylyl cyclase [Deinococcus aerius]GBF06754.1 secreted protein [Deinococcus aerius]